MSGNTKADESERMTIRVLGQDNSLIHFILKKNTPFRKLMSAYAEKKNFPVAALRFTFDGYRITEADTPLSLQLEPDDTIEVYQLQVGGQSM